MDDEEDIIDVKFKNKYELESQGYSINKNDLIRLHADVISGGRWVTKIDDPDSITVKISHSGSPLCSSIPVIWA